MKTITEITALPAVNDFKISAADAKNYKLITITAHDRDEGGNDSVTMSFPWHCGIPFMDVMVQDAIKKCVDTAQFSLLQYIQRKKKTETFMQRVARFLRREWRYMRSMVTVNRNED